MASQQPQGTSSPSASSIFLPLGRRGSRASVSTQAERESLNAALDQIHTAAYQSDSLTVFNDFTSPPVPASATEEKSLSGELQGGLSGLYSRFRTSVGGMRDIVSGVGKTSDKATESSVAKSSERSIHKPSVDATNPPNESHHYTPSSSQGSRLQFSTPGSSQAISMGKGSKLSSKTASISSKASISTSPALKSPTLHMSKSSTSGPSGKDSTAAGIYSAKEPAHYSSNNSVNISSHSLQTMASTGTDKDEPPFAASISSSSFSDRLTHSPALSAKIYHPPNEGPSASDASKLKSAGHVSESSKRSRRSSHELDSTLPAPLQMAKHSPEIVPEGMPPTQEKLRSDSTTSFNPERSSVAASSGATSVSQLPSNGNSSLHEAQGPSTSATSIDEKPKVGEISKVPARQKSKAGPSVSHINRRAAYGASKSQSTDAAARPPALTPINTAVDSFPSRDGRGKRPHDGVVSQLRSKLLSKEFWMRDENAKDCFHCGESFSTFRRKHHCRTCGQIFDSRCTLLIPGDRFGQPGTIRVCKPCEAMINGHDDDSSDFSDSEQSPIIVNPRVSELGLGNYSRMSADDDDSSSVVSQSIEHVMKTPTMAIPATRRAGEGYNRRSAVLEISPDRPLIRPTSSRSLKSALNGRPHAMGHKRHHSRQQFIRNFKSFHDDRAPFQRRNVEDHPPRAQLPAFHKDNIIDPDLAQYLSDDASSGDEQPNLLSAVSEGSLSKSGGDTERTPFSGIFAAMKKGRSAFGDRGSFINSGREGDEASMSSSRAVNLPRASRRRNLSVASSIHRHSPRASKDSVSNLNDSPNAGYVFPTPVKSSGFKMTRSSSMRGAGAPPVELNKASLQHVRKLLRQLLKDALVPRAHSWETALLPILLKAADEVDPDVQNGDDMDIRHYVKLKKIPGGRPGDTSYVSGLVFTKNLALKSMYRSIEHPRIIIITFPLEYARQQQQFMSLEPVIRQEREFLENLVSRISALRPNLLLVEKNVSGLALELLDKAKIATAYNVKSSVLEAVSRCTQTRIITSMDKLVTTPVNSDCGSFDVKTYVYNGRKKTYMYVSGCRRELGCTIVLRGSGHDILTKVKRITEFMIYVVYNLRLETCLMRDEFVQIPTSIEVEIQDSTEETSHTKTNCSQDNPDDKSIVTPSSSPEDSNEKQSDTASTHKIIATSKEIQVPDDVPEPTYCEDIVHDTETKILSASPFVKFDPPYLLKRAREMESRLAYLKQLRDRNVSSEGLSDEKAKCQKFLLITPEMVHQSPPNAPPKVKEVLHAAHDAEYDNALHHYQTQKRQWEAYIAGATRLLDPYVHQNIVVLFSLVCTTTSIPCSGPDIFALEYYNEHGDDAIFEPDCTIGQYVEDICHNANAICTANGCEKRMFEHHRQYVHGEAQISIFVQPYPSKLRGLQNTILMWSCCKICGNETQVFPMSDSTWRYSFGKYLELSFYSKNLHARAGVCPHDLQRDHLRFFGYKDIAIRIHYDPINLLEIIVPRTRVTWKVDNDLKLKNEVYSMIERRLNRFITSVKARLKGINVGSVVPNLAEDCKTEIELLTKKANEDYTTLIRQLQDKYINSRYWEVTPLNEVLRLVQEKVVEWDTAFAEFEKNFFPSEKDIRRLATLQLKKIFLDKDASVASLTSTEETPTTPMEAGNEQSQEITHPRRAMRRMTLSPEKAQDVLVSVVEEDSGKKNAPEVRSPKAEETPLPTPSASPEETKPFPAPGLDTDAPDSPQSPELNIRMSQSEQLLPSSAHSTSSANFPKTASNSVDTNHGLAEPSPEQFEPREDSPEKEEAIEPEKQSIVVSQPPPSAIPRLADGVVRRTGKPMSPPLLRAQSQPLQGQKDRLKNNVPFRGFKIGPGGSGSPDLAPNVIPDPKFKSGDRKFSERFGITALRNSRLAPGPSLIPRSIPTKRNTHVSSLAKHFEQLSREFEKERQRERQQRAAKGTHSRAFPLASSKPIVEVYKNVRDAVEERESPGEVEDESSPTPRIPNDDEPSQESKDSLERGLEEETREDTTSVYSQPHRDEDRSHDDAHTVSDAEGEDVHSDEDHASTEGLHQTESNDELAKMSPEDEQMDLKELPKHERSNLLKMLTNFWSERSASGWAPLDYPLSMSDHVFADCDIIVREDEPSSLIAFALDSGDYKGKLANIQKRYEELDEKRSASEGGSDSVDEARVEHALLRSTGTHLKYQFQEGQAKMLCKIFYAEQFDALRKKCGVSERIVESLSRCAKWDSKGGKTNSLFLKTLDDRFVLKSLSPIETQAFLKFAPAYFQIMSEALFHELPSAIAKMFGFYQVIIKNPATGTECNWFLLMMENLFYDRVPTRIFDLKGSMRNRKVQSTGERNEVLLDENMVDFIYETPLFVREHSKKLLSQSVWNDTLFLGRQNVMDYSLMIAIDESRSELVVGVIDCIRTYTWDKKLESWIKDRGFAGGGKNRPTVTSPKEYKSRFREAMARYVLQAPSCWYQLQPNQPHRYPPTGDLPQAPHAPEGDEADGNAESIIS